ncbi:MAG: peptide deformylase, partial [Candidatus Aerophobetes bacterium]|nr:peptide deformylase [Candidatus Aerophobetes bacterium]
TMYASQGIGLAAPQVGIDKRLIVVDVGEGLLKLINPLILLEEGESILEEGCLSLPGVNVKVKRAKSVVVEGWNEKRKRIKIKSEDLFAHAIQHEVDHLQGILIIDYADFQEI